MSTLRPEHGPTLPALLRRRLGIPVRATVAAVLVLAGALVAAALALGGDDRAMLVQRSDPQFTLLYTESAVRPVDATGGELARLQARRRALGATLTVRRLPDSDLPFGALPLYAHDHIRSLGGVDIRQEGRERVWGAPGYRVEFRDGDVFGLDVFVFPDDVGIEGGVLLSMRQNRPPGGLDEGDRHALDEVRRVQRSFQFGTKRK